MSSPLNILQNRVNEQEKRIEKLWDIAIEHAEHIEKLEATLRDVARCLIDGRILGSESVRAMVEIYHLLKRQEAPSESTYHGRCQGQTGPTPARF